MNSLSRRRCFGFMLLEVMVAMAILSIGIVTVLQSFSSALRAARTGYNSTIATFLAQSKILELEKEDSLAKESLSGDFGKEYPGFRWELEASSVELDSLIPENLRDRSRGEEVHKEGEETKPPINLVNLTVSWVERGVKEEVEFVTYMTNKSTVGATFMAPAGSGLMNQTPTNLPEGR